MHPWVAEQLVKDRMAERQRAAASHRRSVPSGSGPVGTFAQGRWRRGPSRLVGGMLITAGRRLAGPDALVAALEGSRVGHEHSAA